MQSDYVGAPNAQVEALRLATLDLINKCIAFAAEVEEAEADCGAMSIIEIQRHLQYLRGKANALGRTVQ